MRIYLCMLPILAMSIAIGCSSTAPEKQILFNQVLSEFSAEMAKEEQIFAYGSGGAFVGGETQDKISDFSIDFTSNKHVDITQARSLTLRCIKRLLSNINNNEKIRPYLEYYPYRHSGISLILVFSPLGIEDPFSAGHYVHTVFSFDNEIQYRQYNAQKQKEVIILKETYEEALERDAKRSLLVQ